MLYKILILILLVNKNNYNLQLFKFFKNKIFKNTIPNKCNIYKIKNYHFSNVNISENELNYEEKNYIKDQNKEYIDKLKKFNEWIKKDKEIFLYYFMKQEENLLPSNLSTNSELDFFYFKNLNDFDTYLEKLYSIKSSFTINDLSHINKYIGNEFIKYNNFINFLKETALIDQYEDYIKYCEIEDLINIKKELSEIAKSFLSLKRQSEFLIRKYDISNHKDYGSEFLLENHNRSNIDINNNFINKRHFNINFESHNLYAEDRQKYDKRFNDCFNLINKIINNIDKKFNI